MRENRRLAYVHTSSFSLCPKSRVKPQSVRQKMRGVLRHRSLLFGELRAYPETARHGTLFDETTIRGYSNLFLAWIDSAYAKHAWQRVGGATLFGPHASIEYLHVDSGTSAASRGQPPAVLQRRNGRVNLKFHAAVCEAQRAPGPSSSTLASSNSSVRFHHKFTPRFSWGLPLSGRGESTWWYHPFGMKTQSPGSMSAFHQSSSACTKRPQRDA